MADEYEGSYNAAGDFDDDDVFAAPPKAINMGDDWVKGERYRLPVLDRPRLIRGLDANRKPASWPSGEPKMVAVTAVLYKGEKRSLWAPKPSALFAGISAASQSAAESVRAGGMLDILYGGTGKRAPGKNPPHIFDEVVYYPPGQWENQPGVDKL